MEQFITGFIKQVLGNFDFAYMFAVNVLTYIIIKLIDYFNGNRKVPTTLKRVTLVFSVIVLGLIYVYIDYNDKRILINSAILAPVFWTWILKPICVWLKIDYKQIDNTLN